jgi:hypothetical protein
MSVCEAQGSHPACPMLQMALFTCFILGDMNIQKNKNAEVNEMFLIQQ